MTSTVLTLAKVSAQCGGKDVATVELLDASRMGITSIEGEFGSRMKKLRRLDLTENHVEDLGPLAGLRELDWLSLSGNGRIADLSALESSKTLEELDVGRNVVREIPSIGTLRVLLIGNNRLTGLDNIGALTRLEALSISGNTAIADSPWAECCGSADEEPPSDFTARRHGRLASATRLESSLANLDASFCALRGVPMAFALFRSLVVLQLRGNKISGIPRWLVDGSRLPHLKRLDLSRNNISDHSSVVSVFKSACGSGFHCPLKSLDLSGNPVSSSQAVPPYVAALLDLIPSLESLDGHSCFHWSWTIRNSRQQSSEKAAAPAPVVRASGVTKGLAVAEATRVVPVFEGSVAGIAAKEGEPTKRAEPTSKREIEEKPEQPPKKQKTTAAVLSKLLSDPSGEVIPW